MWVLRGKRWKYQAKTQEEIHNESSKRAAFCYKWANQHSAEFKENISHFNTNTNLDQPIFYFKPVMKSKLANKAIFRGWISIPDAFGPL